MSLRVEALEKHFGAVAAVRGVDLDVPSGAFFTLLGPSGCGKTTILRSIAGIYLPDRGRIELDGVEVTTRPMHARNMALVFQNHALFPHMTAFDNIAFGLRMRRVPRAELRARVEEALALVRLDGLGARMPAQLSGGQQQRIALARALVVRPALLLLDEPLSNLDARLRDELRVELRALQRRLGVTTVLVTHDIEEAFVLSDRVAVLRAGRIEQVGTPRELYRTPATRFVANFVGPVNEIPLTSINSENGTTWGTTDAGLRLRLPPEAAAIPDAAFQPDGPRAGAPAGPLVRPHTGKPEKPHPNLHAGAAVQLDAGPPAQPPAWLIVRPEHLHIGPGQWTNNLDAIVEDLVYAGASTVCRLRAGGLSLSVQVPGETPNLTLGANVTVGWHESDSVVRHDA